MPPIILPRRTLHSFRTALKKHLGLKARDDGPPVRIDAGADGGTRLTSIGPDGRGVSLPVPGDRPPGDLVLPFDLLTEAGAARSGDVFLAEADGGDAVVASWDERGVPRSARGTVEKADRDRAIQFDVPSVEEFHDPGPGFAAALRSACAVTDAESTRYALGCVRLDPHAGRIEATDSHHLLIARGFAFPWEEPVLLPAPHVLSTAPLRGEEALVAFVPNGSKVGLIALRCGDWTVWSLEARDARFPDLDRVVPGGEGTACVTLSAADAAFLADRLDRLPGAGADRRPITLEIRDGVFLVRAAEEGGAPVELATASSETRGSAVCVADRRFVARALASGCTEWALCGPEEPVRCDAPAGDGQPGTTVVFATLAGDPVPADGAVRLTADLPAASDRRTTPDTPDAARNDRVPHPTAQTRTTPNMPHNRIAKSANGHSVNGTNGHTINGANGHAVRGEDEPNAAPDHDELLERVSALGSTLSDAASEARSLATDLRKLKRRNRTVTSALAGLKRLGSLVA
ncbi:hypothetical protein [Alienimonas californiensis]|uniref:DNA polymerase III subunit beta n=1 Tax=Alienimonas californiensis TaxID=2527989 RepID=A0A517PAJ9_9PLAN|nr:hypothetical protein [Alienimonas californiensis]QDT16399.1 hypothetical protein CA12_25010 [Alienimonas californiensis]